MSVLQLSRVSHTNGVLTLRLTSDQAVNTVDFWLEVDSDDLTPGAVDPIRITTPTGWQPLFNFPTPGEVIASAYWAEASSASVSVPAGTTLMTLMLNVPSNRSTPLVLNYSGEVNQGIEQAASFVSIDLTDGTAGPISPVPPNGGGGNPTPPGSDLVFKQIDLGPLQVNSQLISGTDLKIVVTGTWPVTNFDLKFELPANTQANGLITPQLTGPAGWSLFSQIENNILEVSAFMPIVQVDGQIVPAPLLAGETLLTLEIESSVEQGQPLPPIFVSGELNETQNLVIERSSVSFAPEIEISEPTFTHWRSKNALPNSTINANGEPQKAAPKDKTEASIGLTDVLSALKIYLGKPLPAEITCPFNAVAADFDGNGSVGLNDVLGLLKYYLGKPTGGLAPEWVFVNANAPTTGINKNNTLLPDVDLTGPAPELIGILRGDVDGSFSL